VLLIFIVVHDNSTSNCTDLKFYNNVPNLYGLGLSGHEVQSARKIASYFPRDEGSSGTK